MDYKAIKKGFFLSFLALCIGFFSGKAYLLHKRKRKLEASIAIVHRPIKVIILTDDEKVVQSAISQVYDNFKIFHLPDNKGVLSLLKEQDPDDIVIFINSHRWFAHDHVLSKINQIYNDKDVLALSCKEMSYPSYNIIDQNEDRGDIYCSVVKELLKNEAKFKSYDVTKVDNVLFLVVKK